MSTQQQRKPEPPKTDDVWIPKDEGAVLEGTVVDIDAAWSKFRAAQQPNDPDAGWYPLLTIARDDGSEIKLHGFRTVLYNELLRKQPVIGERITVTFVGEAPARDGMNGAHVYRVRVHDRQGTAAAYQGMRAPRGPSAGTPAEHVEATAPAEPDSPDDLPF